MPNVIKTVGKLSVPFFTQDPFLFGVYHRDLFPKGDKNMRAPISGNGNHFDPDADFRMYHGRNGIPGFPQHPHRGFETITCTIEGTIDHTDSLGCSGRYGGGDVQWMTAGKGIVHGENFPLLNMESTNLCRFFQLWINLPSRSKMVDPAQVMHWRENVPKINLENGTSVTIWAGKFGDKTALYPCPNSWAADPANDVNIWFITLESGATVSLPISAPSSNRTLYHFTETKGDVLINDSEILSPYTYATLTPATSQTLRNTSNQLVEVLVMQGKPINEPVAQHGPFVMNTQQEIQQAFLDYRKTQFGGWPWDQDAVIFERERDRFIDVAGKTEKPPV